MKRRTVGWRNSVKICRSSAFRPGRVLELLRIFSPVVVRPGWYTDARNLSVHKSGSFPSLAPTRGCCEIQVIQSPVEGSVYEIETFRKSLGLISMATVCMNPFPNCWVYSRVYYERKIFFRDSVEAGKISKEEVNRFSKLSFLWYKMYMYLHFNKRKSSFKWSFLKAWY